MPLQQFRTHKELTDLLYREERRDPERESPSTCLLDSTIRVEIWHEFPLTHLDVLGFPSDPNTNDVSPIQTPDHVYCVETSDVQHPYLHVRFPHAGDIDSKQLNEGVRLVLERYRQQILEHGRIMVSADEPTVDAFEALITDVLNRPFNVIVNSSCGMFYMTAAQRNRLLATTLSPPAGFTVEPVDVDRDGDTIHALWKNGISAEVTKERLRRFPSICARDSEGKLVGWAMTGRFGQISNEFVLPEYRGQGLGKAVELALAQRIARNGRRVFKYVDITNETVYESSLRSLNWTLWREDGERKPIFFRKFEIVSNC